MRGMLPIVVLLAMLAVSRALVVHRHVVIRVVVPRAIRAARWVCLLGPPPPKPDSRPIECIARDARRIGTRFRYPPRGWSFAKFEGTRMAYDEVLCEACAALAIEHLLGVLPPGGEHDLERDRVEYLLGRAGFDLPDVA